MIESPLTKRSKGLVEALIPVQPDSEPECVAQYRLEASVHPNVSFAVRNLATFAVVAEGQEREDAWRLSRT